MAVLALGTLGFQSWPEAERPVEARREPYCARTVTPHGDRAQAREGIGCSYDTGFDDQSPSIQISRNGTLVIARGSGGVLVSHDRGLSWARIDVPALANGDDPAKGAHGYVHIDAVTDRLYYLTSMTAASCGPLKDGAVVSWSDDLGKTWHGKAVGCGTYDWGRLVTGHDPRALHGRSLYYFGVAPRLVGGLRPVYRSRDGGETWKKLRQLASVTTEGGAGVTAPDGTIYFDYPEYIGFWPARMLRSDYPFVPANTCREMIAVSEDFGETWRQQPLPDSRACNLLNGQQRVAVDKAGTVYALWSDDRDAKLYMVVSHDKARTWSRRVQVMPVGATFNNNQANIIAGEKGHVVISSQNTRSPTNPRVWITNGHGEWGAYLAESFNADDAAPLFRSVALDRDGDPSLREGESPSEAEAYLGISPSDEVWASFSRHGGKLGKGSRITAARIQE
ncbi:hypothetical protein V474_02575 [Novosphingobium barchaimii LL02]|uniref:Glycosyl hydrolase n=2 Tax=Novosphingobium barchaimii TaxID=1420591 RepID=A0A0J8A9K8_9SPHN|nr:hypothetical protein V474_02575 [Novosphingobium barchaimii LL02]